MMRILVSAIGLATLAACGGGAVVTDPTSTPGFADPTSTTTSSLTAATLTSLALATETVSGTLNRGTDRYSVGDVSGQINESRTEVAIDGGGLVTFDPGTNTFSTRFDASPRTGDRVVGIVGIPTGSSGLPSGSVSYSGTSNVTIQDNLAFYDLSGDATIVANFDSDRVNTTIDGLSGDRTIGAGNATTVSNVGSIQFTGSALTGATFSGGSPSLDSAQLSNLTGGSSSSLDGAVFGPNGEEIGGVFVIDDAFGSGVVVLGDFLARD